MFYSPQSFQLESEHKVFISDFVQRVIIPFHEMMADILKERRDIFENTNLCFQLYAQLYRALTDDLGKPYVKDLITTMKKLDRICHRHYEELEGNTYDRCQYTQELALSLIKKELSLVNKNILFEQSPYPRFLSNVPTYITIELKKRAFYKTIRDEQLGRFFSHQLLFDELVEKSEIVSRNRKG